MISPLRRWGKVNFWSVYMYFLMRLDSITATWLHSIWEGRWLVAVASATITIVLPVRARQASGGGQQDTRLGRLHPLLSLASKLL